MEQTIYITGHRNPDTDTISATLSYAYLKTALGYNVTPIRLGNLNAETRYVLERFNFKEPQLKYDIKPVVNDLDFDDPIIALKSEPLKDVWQKMLVNNKKTTAVVSEDGILVGVAAISDITSALLSLSIGKYDYMQATPLENIVKVVNGNLVYDSGKYETRGNVVIVTSSTDDFQSNDFSKCLAITSLRSQSQVNAISAGASLVIATTTDKIDPEVLALAKDNACCLITTTLDLIGVTQAITQAIPVGLIMSNKLVTFNLFDYLEDVTEVISKSRYRQYPIVDNSQRVVGMIARFHLLNVVKKKVILVDHNELSQSVEGIEDAEILEIIDHHRLGDIRTDFPVYFRNEICGSSSTIIAELFEQNNVAIPPQYAALMLSAIISDTINFHSPTCTEKDHIQAKRLEKIAGVDIAELSASILRVSASLKSKDASEIVNNDIKEFNINSYKLAIGQVNISTINDLAEVETEVLSYMASYYLANRLDNILMLFSLVDGAGSYLLTAGRDNNLIEAAFAAYLQEDQGHKFLPNIMSRKQQVIPLLSKHLQTLKNR